MKNFNWKSLIPHVIAVVVFLIVALIYCKPVLQGKVLQQIDVVNWKGMAQNAFDYKAKNGHFPLWNTHLFSGMPNYQVAMDGHSFLPDITKILTLGMPKPVSFFFLACVCFYILCVVLRSNVAVGILGSLAFAYCSYDPIIIGVGHESKMLAIAYMPALLAGLLLLYDRKYITGFFLTTLFATMEIGVSHPQINFYFAIVAVFLTISSAITWVKQKDWKHIFISCALAVVAVSIALANSSLGLLTTAEYTKATMRGGKLIESSANGQIAKAKTTGLDESYGFQYSAAKSEFLTFIIPDAMGSSTGEGFDENSKVVSTLTAKGVPEENAVNIAAQLPKYWGGILPSTSGPVYLGAIICILFIIGMVMVDNKYRWWIFAACFFIILISWGKNFEGFNSFLFEHLPLYNKFRAPSMAMVIPQLLFPVMAVLALQKVFFTPASKADLKKSFKKILIVTGCVFVFLMLVYVSSDYSAGYDLQVKANADQQQPGLGSTFVNAMQEGRKEILGAGLLQAIFFAAITLATLFAFLKTSLKPVYLVIVLLVINSINLLYVDNKYLNANSYVDDESYNQNFSPTPAEVEIMKDKDTHFRVLNGGDWVNDATPAYYLRTIGGYHPAKLSIYQDLIEHQLSKGNPAVMDMLDTKYQIIAAQKQGAADTYTLRPSALGACWFVKEVKFVEGPVEEMNGLDNFNPSQTAFVETIYKDAIPQMPVMDSTANIKLISYDNDDITYKSSSKTNQFAVLSEVYYAEGWDAFIDGKKAPYVKTNYVLRGIYVPAGEHNIEFKFEPSSYSKGQTFTYIGNIMVWLAFIAALWAWWRNNKKPATAKN